MPAGPYCAICGISQALVLVKLWLSMGSIIVSASSQFLYFRLLNWSQMLGTCSDGERHQVCAPNTRPAWLHIDVAQLVVRKRTQRIVLIAAKAYKLVGTTTMWRFIYLRGRLGWTLLLRKSRVRTWCSRVKNGRALQIYMRKSSCNSNT